MMKMKQLIMHDVTVRCVPDDAAGTAGAEAGVDSTASPFFTTSFSTLSAAGAASASGVAVGPDTDPRGASLSPYIIDV
jgi:hypothetical protein